MPRGEPGEAAGCAPRWFRAARATLFRRVGGREALLGGALWLLTGRTLDAAAMRWEAERPDGAQAGPHRRPMPTCICRSSLIRRLLSRPGHGLEVRPIPADG